MVKPATTQAGGLGKLRPQWRRGGMLLPARPAQSGLHSISRYPVSGIPPFKSIAGGRAELGSPSGARRALHPNVVSPANAYGLMQVTPDGRQYVCKKYGAL